MVRREVWSARVLGGRVHDQVLEVMPTDELRAAVLISIASIGWTMVANSASIVLGVSAGSAVLVAFGKTGLLDAAGSVALVVHFRHALHHEALSERHERVALHVITLGLATVGVTTLLGERATSRHSSSVIDVRWRNRNSSRVDPRARTPCYPQTPGGASHRQPSPSRGVCSRLSP
jgi:hypothetical protein